LAVTPLQLEKLEVEGCIHESVLWEAVPQSELVPQQLMLGVHVILPEAVQ
jgi:hypothetical protein